jgi:hypothetical protein
MRLIKRPKLRPNQQLTEIRKEVVKAIQPVAAAHTQHRNRVVSSWQSQHKPKFKTSIKVTPKQIQFDVFITNATTSLGKYGGTIGDLWGWINEGTRPHIITPRFATILRFVVNGVTVFAKRVNHPGTKAQKHNQRINKLLLPRLKIAIGLGMRKGFRRAFR